MPAKAGIQRSKLQRWMPAFAGMTRIIFYCVRRYRPKQAPQSMDIEQALRYTNTQFVNHHNIENT